jgi:hypothetical protein
MDSWLVVSVESVITTCIIVLFVSRHSTVGGDAVVEPCCLMSLYSSCARVHVLCVSVGRFLREEWNDIGVYYSTVNSVIECSVCFSS